MTKNEALIEMIKGNKVQNINGVVLYRRDGSLGDVKFYGICSGRIEEAVGWIRFEDGYELVPEKYIITINGKDIELSEESFNNLKEQLCKG